MYAVTSAEKNIVTAKNIKNDPFANSPYTYKTINNYNSDEKNFYTKY